MAKRLKLSGKMVTIPISRATGEAEMEQEHPRLSANQIVAAIIDGGYDNDDLQQISQAVRTMWKANRSDRLMEAQHKLHNGVVVMLKGIRPQKLIGITGQVENFHPTCRRANLRVTAAQFYTGYVKGDLIRGIPLTCFDIIPEDVLRRAASNGE